MPKQNKNKKRCHPITLNPLEKTQKTQKNNNMAKPNQTHHKSQNKTLPIQKIKNTDKPC